MCEKRFIKVAFLRLTIAITSHSKVTVARISHVSSGATHFSVTQFSTTSWILCSQLITFFRLDRYSVVSIFPSFLFQPFHSFIFYLSFLRAFFRTIGSIERLSLGVWFTQVLNSYREYNSFPCLLFYCLMSSIDAKYN